MTLEALGTLLNTIAPAAYLVFPEDEEPSMPYITFAETEAENFGADDKVYHSGRRVMVALYTRERDTTLEGSLEAAFNQADLYWTRSVDWLDDEDAYEIIYFVEV